MGRPVRIRASQTGPRVAGPSGWLALGRRWGAGERECVRGEQALGAGRGRRRAWPRPFLRRRAHGLGLEHAAVETSASPRLGPVISSKLSGLSLLGFSDPYVRQGGGNLYPPVAGSVHCANVVPKTVPPTVLTRFACYFCD